MARAGRSSERLARQILGYGLASPVHGAVDPVSSVGLLHRRPGLQYGSAANAFAKPGRETHGTAHRNEPSRGENAVQLGVAPRVTTRPAEMGPSLVAGIYARSRAAQSMVARAVNAPLAQGRHLDQPARVTLGTAAGYEPGYDSGSHYAAGSDRALSLSRPPIPTVSWLGIAPNEPRLDTPAPLLLGTKLGMPAAAVHGQYSGEDLGGDRERVTGDFASAPQSVQDLDQGTRARASVHARGVSPPMTPTRPSFASGSAQVMNQARMLPTVLASQIMRAEPAVSAASNAPTAASASNDGPLANAATDIGPKSAADIEPTDDQRMSLGMMPTSAMSLTASTGALPAMPLVSHEGTGAVSQEMPLVSREDTGALSQEIRDVAGDEEQPEAQIIQSANMPPEMHLTQANAAGTGPDFGVETVAQPGSFQHSEAIRHDASPEVQSVPPILSFVTPPIRLTPRPMSSMSVYSLSDRIFARRMPIGRFVEPRLIQTGVPRTSGRANARTGYPMSGAPFAMRESGIGSAYVPLPTPNLYREAQSSVNGDLAYAELDMDSRMARRVPQAQSAQMAMMAQRPRVSQGTGYPIGAPLSRITRSTTADSVLSAPHPMADRTPHMPLPPRDRTAVLTDENSGLLIQRSELGDTPSGTTSMVQREGAAHEPHEGGSQSNPSEAGGGKGGGANDVNLLANEVWALLKRRLAYEAERMGR